MSLSDFQTSYQISPIFLVGGIAGTGVLPIVSLLASANYANGITSQADANPPVDNFGRFRLIPGGTLMDMEVATYPFANQTTAANAVITNGLRVSLEMVVPAGGSMTMSNKQSIMDALKSSLDNHTAQGGYYTVATPSYVYQGCLLTTLVDTTDDDDYGKQPQVRWTWNFYQPLLTEAAAQAAQNQAMAKITNQTQNAGDPPGSDTVASGISQPSSNIVQNIVPAASTPAGSNIAPTTSPGGTTSLSSISPISPGG